MSVDPILNPTWYGNIRHMFTKDDITHMRPHGFDLAHYDSVKQQAPNIYGQVSAGHMPPGNPWSDTMVTTFKNWLINGCPKGILDQREPKLASLLAVRAPTPKAGRIRKNVGELSGDELATAKEQMLEQMLEPTSLRRVRNV